MHEKFLRQGLIYSNCLIKVVFNLTMLMSLSCLILSPGICNKYLVYVYKVKLILQDCMGERKIKGDIYTIERKMNSSKGRGENNYTKKKNKVFYIREGAQEYRD